jgi:uncharacterized protein YuzB (UPF0349 family)
MQVHLCKKAVERAPGGAAAIVSALREREHVPVVKDCLNRCERCERGEAIAVVDGAPLGAPSYEALLRDIDALAAEDV